MNGHGTITVNKAALIKLVEDRITELQKEAKARKASFDLHYPTHLRNYIKYRIAFNNWMALKSKHINDLLKSNLNLTDLVLLDKKFSDIRHLECTCSICNSEPQRPDAPPEVMLPNGYLNNGTTELDEIYAFEKSLAVLKISAGKTVKVEVSIHNCLYNLIVVKK